MYTYKTLTTTLIPTHALKSIGWLVGWLVVQCIYPDTNFALDTGLPALNNTRKLLTIEDDVVWFQHWQKTFQRNMHSVTIRSITQQHCAGLCY